MTPHEKAEALVTNWFDNQLRTEGRAGLYIDDIAGLTFDIETLIKSVRKETLEEAAHVADMVAMALRSIDDGRSEEATMGLGAISAAQAIRRLGKEG